MERDKENKGAKEVKEIAGNLINELRKVNLERLKKEYRQAEKDKALSSE
jgi:hypothetical protein